MDRDRETSAVQGSIDDEANLSSSERSMIQAYRELKNRIYSAQSSAVDQSYFPEEISGEQNTRPLTMDEADFVSAVRAGAFPANLFGSRSDDFGGSYFSRSINTIDGSAILGFNRRDRDVEVMGLKTMFGRQKQEQSERRAVAEIENLRDELIRDANERTAFNKKMTAEINHEIESIERLLGRKIEP